MTFVSIPARRRTVATLVRRSCVIKRAFLVLEGRFLPNVELVDARTVVGAYLLVRLPRRVLISVCTLLGLVRPIESLTGSRATIPCSLKRLVGILLALKCKILRRLQTVKLGISCHCYHLLVERSESRVG